MLEIEIPETEFYDEENEIFITSKPQKFQLEHSLLSISKWESRWKKPFISNEKKSIDETIDYIRCMTVTRGVDPIVYRNLNSKVLEEIQSYIDDPMTATTFQEYGGRTGRDRQVKTSEVYYSYMVALGIPFECEKWHFNRLLTLIKVCNTLNNTSPKKMSRSDVIKQNRDLNAKRRSKLGTKG